MTITLAELRTQSRQRSDMEDSLFVQDAELTSYINSSIAELHDILVQAYSEDYAISDYEFSTVSGQQDYALPSDFYKVRGVDAKLNGNDWFNLQRYNFNERNRFENFGSWSVLGVGSVRYRLVGSNLRLSPMPSGISDIKLWYIPVATKLVDDADTLDDLNGYHEYVIVDAAIKMLQKQDLDVTVLMTQKMQLKQRIEEAAENRDAANPEAVEDIYASSNDAWRWGTRG